MTTTLRISYTSRKHVVASGEGCEVKLVVDGELYDYASRQVVSENQDGSVDLLYRFSAIIDYDLDDTGSHPLKIGLIERDEWGIDVPVLERTYQLKGEPSKLINLNEQEEPAVGVNEEKPAVTESIQRPVVSGDRDAAFRRLYDGKPRVLPYTMYSYVGFENDNSISVRSGKARLYGTDIHVDSDFTPAEKFIGYLSFNNSLKIIVGPKFCFKHYDLFWNESTDTMRLKMRINGTDIPLPKFRQTDFENEVWGFYHKFFFNTMANGKEGKPLFGGRKRRKYDFDLTIQLLDEEKVLLEKVKHISEVHYSTITIEIDEP